MVRVCNKCKIEKDINEFYSYYHSVQKKTRTRFICNGCMNIQKKEYKRKKKLNGHNSM